MNDLNDLVKYFNKENMHLCAVNPLGGTLIRAARDRDNKIVYHVYDYFINLDGDISIALGNYYDTLAQAFDSLDYQVV